MKTLTLSIILSLYAEKTPDNEFSFFIMCDKVLAMLCEKYGHYDLDDGCYDHFSWHHSYGSAFSAELYIELNDPYDLNKYTEEELQGLIAGSTDLSDTAYFKSILANVDNVMNHEELDDNEDLLWRIASKQDGWWNENWSVWKDEDRKDENAYFVKRDYKLT